MQECLKSTSVDIYQLSGNQAYQGKLGAGRVDALAAVECALSKGSGKPIARFSADQTFGCGSLTVAFTDQSSLSPTSWSWDFGDGTTSTDQNPTHTYTSPGTYTVELTVTNENGDNTLAQTDYITVEPGGPYAPESAGQKDWIQQDGGYQDNIPVDNSIYMVFEALTDITLKSIKVYAKGAGNREFAITDNQGNGLAEPIVAYVPDGESRVNLNWNIPPGTYWLVHRNSAGNMINLYRDRAGASYPKTIPGVISITSNYAIDNNLGGENSWYVGYDWEVQRAGCDPTAISVIENPEPEVKIYPNPVNNLFTIELAERQESVQVKLYNLIGEVVYEENLGVISGPVKHQVNLANLPSGNYLLHVTTGNKAISRKIIKE